MATKKSGEFYSFAEVLRILNVDENRLKRLVSEGELGAVKDGGQMWFRRTQVDGMAGRRGGASDTAVPEIEMVDEGGTRPAAKRPSDLGEDLLSEPEPTEKKKAGMKTSEISSQDTFIDQGGDVGMSTEPIEFTPESATEEVEEIGAEAVAPASRRKVGGAAVPSRKAPAPVEAKTGPLWVFLLLLGTLVSVFAGFVVYSGVQQSKNDLSGWFAEKIGGVKPESPIVKTPENPLEVK